MKRPQGRGGRKRLDSEDEQIWLHASQSVEPLKRKKLRNHAAVEALGDADRPARKLPAERAAPSPLASPPPRPPSSPAPPTKASKDYPPIAELERKKARKLRAGRTEIEARIDLHGLRQHEAHDALLRFLQSCQARGKRYALVITGKGKPGDESGHGARERGVLRANVPRWLQEPEFRALVVSYEAAAIRHGGDGALYVHIRKRS